MKIFLKMLSNLQIIIFSTFLIVTINLKLLEAQEKNNFISNQYSISMATKIVNRLERYCPKDYVIDWDAPNIVPSRNALVLLGRPVAPLLIDTIETHIRCSKIQELFIALNSLESIGSTNFSKEDFNNMRKLFGHEPNFPSNKELELKSFEELTKIYHEAQNYYSNDSHRIILWYFNYIDKILQNETNDEKISKAVNGIRSVAFFYPAPQLVQLLLKFSVCPYNLGEPNTQQSNLMKVLLRSWALQNLSNVYKNTLSGVTHISLIDVLNNPSNLQFSPLYIEIALNFNVDIDMTILKELLAKTQASEKASIAESLGKSGNRSYRKILLSLLQEKDEKVQNSAAVGLAYLGDDSGTKYIKRYLKTLKIYDSAYGTIITSLGRLGTDEASNILCDQLEEHVKTQGNLLPDKIINALRDSCNSSTVDRLFKIRNSNGDLYRFIDGAIQVTADERSIPVLAKYLDDKKPEVAQLSAKLMLTILNIKFNDKENPVELAQAWWEKSGGKQNK